MIGLRARAIAPGIRTVTRSINLVFESVFVFLSTLLPNLRNPLLFVWKFLLK
jgi:hypothetical protein